MRYRTFMKYYHSNVVRGLICLTRRSRGRRATCRKYNIILMKAVNRPFVRKGIIRNWLRIICFVLFI